MTDRAALQTLALGDVLKLVEFRTKIVSVSSLLIGTAWAAWAGHPISAAVFALLFAATECVDLGTAGFNSYFDFLRGVDTVHTDYEKYKVLVHTGVDPRIALRISLGVFAVAGVFGALLGWRVGWEVVAVGVAGMLVAFFYSAGPLPLAATPVGEFFAGGLLGFVVVVLATYVQSHSLPRGALLLGVPSTLLIADILTVNNTCDIEGDARAGRRTLSIVLGRARSAWLIYALVAATYASALALILAGALPKAAAGTLALGALFTVRELRRMHARGYSHPTKAASMGGISAIFLVYSLAVLAALAIDAALR